jgi:hypothetical protein
LVEVALYQNPDKMFYNLDQFFTVAGAILKATYSDGSSELVQVTDGMCAQTRLTQLGSIRIPINYRGFTVYVNATVVPNYDAGYYYPSYSESIVATLPPADLIVEPAPIAPSTVGHTGSIETQTSLAEELRKIGMFFGTGDDIEGNPAYELERPLTRLEALAIVMRLMGLEDEAQQYTGANTFRDVPEWGERISAYAYSLGITQGVNDAHTLFDPERIVTYREFTAFLLRVLGYFEKNGDFEYDKTIEKSVDVGLYTRPEMMKLGPETGHNQYTRGSAVISMVDALLTAIKDENSLLIQKLIADNAIEDSAAEAFIKAVQSIYNHGVVQY